MTLQELTAILTPFALALRQSVDVATFRAYHGQLKDVPAKLLQGALEQFGAEGVRFLPTAPEMRSKAEAVRRQLAAEHPYEPCSACNGIGHRKVGYIEQPGFRIPKYDRCQCWYEHQARLTELGIGDKSLLAKRLPSPEPTDVRMLATGEALND